MSRLVEVSLRSRSEFDRSRVEVMCAGRGYSHRRERMDEGRDGMA